MLMISTQESPAYLLSVTSLPVAYMIAEVKLFERTIWNSYKLKLSTDLSNETGANQVDTT